jgi:hypothetical protein
VVHIRNRHLGLLNERPLNRRNSYCMLKEAVMPGQATGVASRRAGTRRHTLAASVRQQCGSIATTSTLFLTAFNPVQHVNSAFKCSCPRAGPHETYFQLVNQITSRADAAQWLLKRMRISHNDLHICQLVRTEVQLPSGDKQSMWQAYMPHGLSPAASGMVGKAGQLTAAAAS